MDMENHSSGTLSGGMVIRKSFQRQMKSSMEVSREIWAERMLCLPSVWALMHIRESDSYLLKYITRGWSGTCPCFRMLRASL